MRAALPQGPVLVQVPRAGYRLALVCQGCREPVRCRFCSGPTRIADAGALPVCGWCGRAQVDWSCPICESRSVRAPVVGAERTAEELGRAFPQTPVRQSVGGRTLAERAGCPGHRRGHSGGGAAGRGRLRRCGAAGHRVAAAAARPAGRRGGAAALAQRRGPGPERGRRRLGHRGGGELPAGRCRPWSGSTRPASPRASWPTGPRRASRRRSGWCGSRVGAEALAEFVSLARLPRADRRCSGRCEIGRMPGTDRRAGPSADPARAASGRAGAGPGRAGGGRRSAAPARATARCGSWSTRSAWAERRAVPLDSCGAHRLRGYSRGRRPVPGRPAGVPARGASRSAPGRTRPSGRGKRLSAEPGGGARGGRWPGDAQAEPPARPGLRRPARPSWPPTAVRWWPTARCCRSRVLDIPPHGWVNLHFSLLPAWRGAAPVQRAILAGDQVTGATTFRIVLELDAGPTFASMTEPIRPTDTSGDLLGRLAVRGAELLVRPWTASRTER